MIVRHILLDQTSTVAAHLSPEDHKETKETTERETMTRIRCRISSLLAWDQVVFIPS